jgi:GroES-like protein
MKAAQHTTYNKNNITLNITEVAKPSITDKQVLVKVTAAGVNPLDNMISRGEVKMIVPYKLPQTAGNEVGGIVESIGKQVDNFQIGDRVFGRLPLDHIGASVGSDKELINSALITTVSKKLTNGEVAIIALVQENDESVLNAIFEKYQVDIARWDVATVAAEIESALKIQEDLEHQAKARLIADKKEARREKFDKLKASIKEKFSKKN